MNRKEDRPMMYMIQGGFLYFDSVVDPSTSFRSAGIRTLDDPTRHAAIVNIADEERSSFMRATSRVLVMRSMPSLLSSGRTVVYSTQGALSRDSREVIASPSPTLAKPGWPRS
jgi:hypothetical protein